MSNMLEQAIVDAEALKEAAIKNAEATIIEKYSDDIKNVVDQLLEQEMPPMPMDPAMMMGGPMPPQGPPPGPENMAAIPGAHEMAAESTVIVDLGQLKDQLLAESEGVDPKDVETHFALLKRTAKSNRVEFFRVTSGPKKTQNALKTLNMALYNIKNKRYIKNRLSCPGGYGCKFYNTKHSP